MTRPAILIHTLQEVFPRADLPEQVGRLSLALVQIGLDPGAEPEAASLWLADDELSVPVSWRSQKRRRHWFAGRVAAKATALPVGEDPRRAHVSYSDRGSPLVIVADGTHVPVTITHSGEWAMACQVPHGWWLGLDYEVGAADKLHLVEKVCSVEERRLNDLLEASGEAAGARFARIWTLKEACLKAVEVGLTEDLHAIVVVAKDSSGAAALQLRSGQVAQLLTRHDLARAAVALWRGHPLAVVAAPR